MPYIDRFHSCGAYGGQSEIRIFEGAAELGIDAELACGFEEDVGSWFLVFHIFIGDDGIEPVDDPELGEDLGYRVL